MLPPPKPPRVLPPDPINRGSASRSWDIWSESPSIGECTIKSYFADVYKAAHEILVAKLGDSLLGLIPGRIFHNSICIGQYIKSCLIRNGAKLTRIPTNNPGQSPNPSIQNIQQRSRAREEIPGSTAEAMGKGKENYAMKPTFDIPLGSSNTSAKRTSPAITQQISPRVIPPHSQSPHPVS